MFKQGVRLLAISLILGLVASKDVEGKTIAGVCYEPKGERFDFINGEFEGDKDGYSNSNPTFLFDTENPTFLIETWQSAQPWPELMSREETDKIVPPTAIKSSVLFNSPEVIYAHNSSERETYTTTLYLNQGIAIFTRVRVIPAKPEEFMAGALGPMGAVYVAKCTFQEVQ